MPPLQVYPSCGDVRLGFFANPDTAATKLHPFMSGEQVPTAAAMAEASAMAEGVSTGSLSTAAAAQQAQDVASAAQGVRAQSEASSPSASGTSTPAAALRASAPLPMGLAMAVNAALPPRAPKPLASLGQGGTASPPGQPAGAAAGGQQQQQQGGRPGKSLGFRFRFWGGNKNPRGSTDGTPPPSTTADTHPGSLGDAASLEALPQPEGASSATAGSLHGDSNVPLGSPSHPGFRRRGALSEPSASPRQSPRTSIDVSGGDSAAPRHHAAEYLMGRTGGLAGGDVQTTRVPLTHTAIEEEGEEGAGSAAHMEGPNVKASLDEFMVPLDCGIAELGVAEHGSPVADTVDP